MRKRILATLLIIELLVLGLQPASIVELYSCQYVEAATNVIVITEQPQDVIGSGIQIFQVSATGFDLTYQWYRKLATDSAWNVWEGKNSDHVTFVAGAGNYGMKVRCVVTDGNGNSVTSDTASLVENIKISFMHVKAGDNGSMFPGNSSLSEMGNVGDSLYMEVTVKGSNNLTYQWYYKEPEGEWTKWTGQTSAVVNTIIQKEWNGKKFKCVISNSNESIETAVVTLAVSDRIIENAQEVWLYAIDEKYSSYLDISSEYLQSYILPSSSYSILYGDSVMITGSKVEPKATTWYYHQSETSSVEVGTTTPTGASDEYSMQAYTFGDTAIKLNNGQVFVFHVIDYASNYCNNLIEQYLDKNISSSMTEYEKAEVCCQYVASYNYGTKESHYVGMLLSGAGDCWASTSALLYMFDKLGIVCDSRYAGKDSNAKSGHYNVIAILDGVYYVVDAGYSGKAPRTYSVTEYKSIFSYKKLTSTTISITDCLDLGEMTEIIIPTQIDGYTVTEIGDSAFANLSIVESITIPNTVTNIGKKAFANNKALKSISIPNSVISIGIDCFCFDYYLQEIRIPASVKTIGDGSFLYCSSLTGISVDSANQYYCSKDGVLFNKDCSTLVFYPENHPGATYEVPSTVETLGDWCFAQTRNSNICLSELKEVILPDTLKHIGSHAFYGIYLAELVLPESITSIPAYAFYRSEIQEVVLPKNLTNIEEYAFYGADILMIDFPDSLVSIGDYAFTSCNTLLRTYIPPSVKSIGDYAFYLNYGWSSMGETGVIRNYIWIDKNCNANIGIGAFDSVVVGVKKETTGYQYAVHNSVAYVLLNDDQKISLDSSWFSLKSKEYVYKGKAVIPSVSTGNVDRPFYLYEGLDYYLSCSNNEKAGTATVSVNGLYVFDGKISYEFTILEARPKTTTLPTEKTAMPKTTETPTIEKPTTSPLPVTIKKGTKITIANNIYTVTNASKKTVSFNGLVKKTSKKITIPATIIYNNQKYKVTAIGKNAFSKNKTITSVTIGKNLTSIGEKAFYKCTKLMKITIPSKVNKIGKQAFQSCSKLKNITIKTTKLTTKNVGNKAFKGIANKAVIKVPESKKKAYQKMLKKKRN